MLWPFDRRLGSVHRPGRAAVDDDEVRRLALAERRRQAAARPEHPRRARRQRLDRAHQRQDPGIDRRQHDPDRRLDPADPVRRPAELDVLVDLGVRRVVGRDGVRGAVDAAPRARRPRPRPGGAAG